MVERMERFLFRCNLWARSIAIFNGDTLFVLIAVDIVTQYLNI